MNRHGEQPLVPFVVGPGYILSRSKTKCAVTIKDEFFEVAQDGENRETLKDRLVKEVEFLQGAFESYKSSLHSELDEKWKKKEEDLQRQLEAMYDAVAVVMHHVKVRLMEFEERFQEKVAEVDDKYRLKLQDLMSQNTELKRLYVRKCGQLFDEKALTDRKTQQEVQSAKSAMENLIRSKHRANVSVALTPETASPRPRAPKLRPSSAPGTKYEADVAHWSAGETDHLFRPTEYIRPDNIIPPEDPETEKVRQELLATDVKKFTKEDLLSSFDV
nr:hypothetical protein BaRGS_027773 [Batillaria attramentaria]